MRTQLKLTCLSFFIFTSVFFSQEKYAPHDSLNAPFSQKIKVYLFLSPECPLCQSYAYTLKKLYNEFEPQGVEFTGIISGTYFTEEEVNSYKRRYQIPFALEIDTAKKLAKTLNAKITPQAVVENKLKQVVYSGRIDNWAYAPGKKRKNVTDETLKNVLLDILQEKTVRIAKTEAIGCFIE